MSIPLIYKADGRIIRKLPVETKIEGGSRFSIGFPVCTISEYVEDQGEAVADLLNRGEAYDAKDVEALQKKADALEHWRQEVGKLHSQVARLLECLKDCRRHLSDQDAIDLEYLDSVIAKADRGTITKAGETSEGGAE
jgi:hypothetical protein